MPVEAVGVLATLVAVISFPSLNSALASVLPGIQESWKFLFSLPEIGGAARLTIDNLFF